MILVSYCIDAILYGGKKHAYPEMKTDGFEGIGLGQPADIVFYLLKKNRSERALAPRSHTCTVDNRYGGAPLAIIMREELCNRKFAVKARIWISRKIEI